MFRRVLSIQFLAIDLCAANEDYVSGQGNWRYQYLPELLQLPDSEAGNDKDGHGVTLDREANIYFTFHPKSVTNETQVLVRFDPSGANPVLLGKPGPDGLSSGTPHGLRFEYDPVSDASFLYHANNAHKVMKTTLNGDIVWTADFSHWETDRPEFWPCIPTDTIVVPGTDELLVADGYGSYLIHVLNKSTGEYLENRTFGGNGTSTAPLRFNTPHGINLDKSRAGTFIVSDRSNNRIVRVTERGEFVDETPAAPLPCNVDVHNDNEEGFVTLVPKLGLTYQTLTNGSVAMYNKDAQLLSTIEIANTIGHLGHQHPHDALFLANGDVVVCCWSGPSNPGQGPSKGTISYWRRLPKEPSALIV